MVVLVTGGAGYIGSHTCKALKKAGFTPVSYDNLSTGHKSAVKWGPLVIGDLQDKEQLLRAFEEYKPTSVLHFAASALVVESMSDPAKYYHNNVVGSLSLLEAMRASNVTNLIFSSTCATYGHPVFSPITEEHPQIPINPYGRSKLMVEQMIQDYDRVYGLKAVILRYFNAAGADSTSEIGEDHTPETHIIPSIIEVAQEKRKEIVIYGDDFPTQDGSAVRDYIHVEDLARAHVKALKWLLANQKSAAINLGTGKGSSILEVIREIEKVSSQKIAVRKEERREGEPSHLVADFSKAKKLLGWIPKFSRVPHIVKTAWQWHNR